MSKLPKLPKLNTEKEYRRRAKILRDAGAMDIPDLRKKLTPAQKGRIHKLTEFNKKLTDHEHMNPDNMPPLRSYVRNPDLFTVEKIKSRKISATLKSSGYQVVNGVAFIRNEGIAKTKTDLANGIIKYVHPHRIETVYLATHKDFFNKAQEVFNRELPHNEFVGGRFGNYGLFNTRLESYDAFYRYVSDLTNNFTAENSRTLQLVHIELLKPKKSKTKKSK